MEKVPGPGQVESGNNKDKWKLESLNVLANRGFSKERESCWDHGMHAPDDGVEFAIDTWTAALVVGWCHWSGLMWAGEV